MFGIKGIEAVQFSSGVPGVELPVDGGPSPIALRYQGIDFPLQSRRVRGPLLEATAGQYAELDLRHVQPTPVLGRIVKLQPPGNPPGLGCRESLVQRRRAMGVQIVQHQPHHLGFRVGFIHQPAHLPGEVLHRSPFGDLHVPPAGQGFASQEQVAGPLPPVLVVLPQRQPRLCGQRRDGCRPTTGWRSRQSRPPASGGLGVRRTGPARPPYSPRTRRSPWGCTTPSSATA